MIVQSQRLLIFPLEKTAVRKYIDIHLFEGLFILFCCFFVVFFSSVNEKQYWERVRQTTCLLMALRNPWNTWASQLCCTDGLLRHTGVFGSYDTTATSLFLFLSGLPELTDPRRIRIGLRMLLCRKVSSSYTETTESCYSPGSFVT